MKKLIALLSLVFVFLVLTACSSGSATTAFVFDLSEGVESAGNNEYRLVVSPDYDSRTLSVDYSFESNPYAEGDSDALFDPNMVSMDGSIGGDFFDRFEAIDRAFAEREGRELGDTDFVFSIEEGKDSVRVFDLDDDHEESAAGVEEILNVQSFYRDIVAMFTEDTY